MQRDGRVALNIADPANVSRYYAVRGRVVSISAEGGAEHIERLSQKYLGGPYPWFGGREQTRLVVVIEPEKITSPQG